MSEQAGYTTTDTLGYPEPKTEAAGPAAVDQTTKAAETATGTGGYTSTEPADPGCCGGGCCECCDCCGCRGCGLPAGTRGDCEFRFNELCCLY